jgi:hypothetical protein
VAPSRLERTTRGTGLKRQHKPDIYFIVDKAYFILCGFSRTIRAMNASLLFMTILFVCV